MCSCSGASPAANLHALHLSATRKQACKRPRGYWRLPPGPLVPAPHFWLYADTLLPVDVSACLISAIRAAESAMAPERLSVWSTATSEERVGWTRRALRPPPAGGPALFPRPVPSRCDD